MPKLLDSHGKQHHKDDRRTRRRELMEALEEAGAVAVKTISKMAVRKREQPLESVSRATIKEGQTDDASTDDKHSDGGAAAS
ncbi:hypothetical protein, partial [Tritonibacter sp. SIMBA_163]|uniref:hypothetical protein n=1 Tax=Tritonibacter sp. SIMBA_163 TaxID=3080868 RepID=UPI003980809D